MVLYEVTSDVEPLFLKTGFILACFHADGYFLFASDLLNITAKGSLTQSFDRKAK